MEFYLHGLHRETSPILRFWHHSCYCQLAHQAIHLHSYSWYNAPLLAKLFMLHVLSKHGALSHVTSDCGMEFVLSFFWTLRKALDMKLDFTSRYHLEGNGQAEHNNQTLEQFLRVYCNYQQDNVTVVTPSQLWYSCNSGNVPGPHIILRVELLTPFTSGLSFLLCSSFVLTLLIRKCHFVVLLFCSIVLHSQIYLWSELRTPCCYEKYQKYWALPSFHKHQIFFWQFK